MPSGGWFFDAIIRQEDIDLDEVDSKGNKEEFGDVTDEDLAYIKRGSRPGEGDGALCPRQSRRGPRSGI